MKSALKIAADVASGRISAQAVVADTLERIAREDPALNAFTVVLAEQALADARVLDVRLASGEPAPPLAGVPFAVKNLFDIEGVTTLAGSKVLAGRPAATRDAPLIARLKSAGAVLVGALNMDEFAYGFVTENFHYGATHNPHALDCVAGGSSGGSAAAVAGGLVPLALGTDTNGSIRVPAGLCGIFGLKPTFGRLDREGAFPFVDSLDHTGPFARTIEDLAAAYLAIADQDAAADVDLGRPLRVGALGGWFTRGAFPEALEGFRRAGQALDATFDIELEGAEAARSAAFYLTTYEGARLHEADIQARPADYDPAVRDRLRAGLALPEAVAEAAQAYRLIFQAKARALFERFDVLLAPTTPCPAPRIGQATMRLNGEEVSVRRNLGAYTQPISYIGLPVIAAPVFAPGALPVGVQIIAPAWREDLAFAAARRLEALGVALAHPPEART